jgi:dihydrodipicolinate synthase/N-acetylneuraminate lyase
MATPYTETKAVAFEDLAAEVDFLDRCGVQGMDWPQSASEYTKLTEDERMQGMDVLAKSARSGSFTTGVTRRESVKYSRSSCC